MEDGRWREEREKKTKKRRKRNEGSWRGSGKWGRGGRSTANTELDHRQYGKTVVRMIRNYAGDAEKAEEVGKR